MELKKYLVIKKQFIAPGVATLNLTTLDKGPTKYRPGQYIKVYFPDLAGFKGKEYSLSSAPQEPDLAITVRAIGKFSNRLCSLQPGDTFLGSNPTGLFNLARHSSNTVMVASGMGIAPFRSIILDEFNRRARYKMNLFYSAKKTDDLLFNQDLQALIKNQPNFKFHKFITQENISDPNIIKRRIKISDVLEVIKKIETTSFMLCGSTSFNATYRQELVNIGVSQDNIYSETLL